MSSFFSYESKPMQILMGIGDLIILNFLYLLCCVPIFTIGAAQAGMYTAAKVMLDKEDDSSLVEAFFRGFRSGFKSLLGGWGIVTLALVLTAFSGFIAVQYGAPAWLAYAGFIVCVLFQTLIPLFHSRFSCTAKQLIRNAWFLLFAHPLRSIAATIVLWVPFGLFMYDVYTFMSFTAIWATLYFSTAMLFAYTFMKKPFNTLIDHFNKTHAEENAEEATESNEEEYEEAAEEETPALPE